jgi:hypothetical protein
MSLCASWGNGAQRSQERCPVRGPGVTQTGEQSHHMPTVHQDGTRQQSRSCRHSRQFLSNSRSRKGSKSSNRSP